MCVPSISGRVSAERHGRGCFLSSDSPEPTPTHSYSLSLFYFQGKKKEADGDSEGKRQELDEQILLLQHSKVSS